MGTAIAHEGAPHGLPASSKPPPASPAPVPKPMSPVTTLSRRFLNVAPTQVTHCCLKALPRPSSSDLDLQSQLAGPFWTADVPSRLLIVGLFVLIFASYTRKSHSASVARDDISRASLAHKASLVASAH
ncbi:hypothetical protein PAL_GLEAN10012224 [Pteropus alecto]|uniref:Uncharacterized protein n=1 Tax=Pteropus alecto TaxID=9402 RepID=L5KBP5_PTEAL|nr:hypothetical protein PAL_GLEAN10012224 [Pteropus alecto]